MPGEITEVLARAMHEAYLAEQRARGIELFSKRSMVPWERLEYDLQASNRAVASAIEDSLSVVPIRVVDVQQITERFTFEPDELELLARNAHEDWCSQLRSARRNDVEDDVNRQALLVPYDALPEHEKQKDRDLFLRLPTILEPHGLGLSKSPAK